MTYRTYLWSFVKKKFGYYVSKNWKWEGNQSNREGERDTEENRGEIDSESECEQSEDETFRNVNKFVEIDLIH